MEAAEQMAAIWKEIELDEDAFGWLRTYLRLDDQIHDLEGRRKEARRHIEEYLGEAERGTVNGKSVVRWTSVSRNTLDTLKLKECWPDVASECTKLQVVRRFTVVAS